MSIWAKHSTYNNKYLKILKEYLLPKDRNRNSLGETGIETWQSTKFKRQYQHGKCQVSEKEWVHLRKQSLIGGGVAVESIRALKNRKYLEKSCSISAKGNSSGKKCRDKVPQVEVVQTGSKTVKHLLGDTALDGSVATETPSLKITLKWQKKDITRLKPQRERYQQGTKNFEEFL